MILQKGERDDNATVKFKSVMTFKTMIGKPKLPNQKQTILQSNRGISQIDPGKLKRQVTNPQNFKNTKSKNQDKSKQENNKGQSSPVESPICDAGKCSLCGQMQPL